MSTQAAPIASPPWWSYGHVWMVIGGPAVVVVASMITLWIAISNPDPVVDEDYYRKGVAINKALADDPSLAPAVAARNHAATPVASPSAQKP